jgi:hypothetical protein
MISNASLLLADYWFQYRHQQSRVASLEGQLEDVVRRLGNVEAENHRLRDATNG